MMLRMRSDEHDEVFNDPCDEDIAFSRRLCILEHSILDFSYFMISLTLRTHPDCDNNVEI